MCWYREFFTPGMKKFGKRTSPFQEPERMPAGEPLDAHIMDMPYKQAKEAVLNRFNHEYVGARLSTSSGNITQAARQCGLDRQALQQVMKRFGINPDDFR